MSASDAKGLVGIDKRIEQIVSLLEREDVRSVGIWGIGGIGKTTLVEAVFNRICSQVYEVQGLFHREALELFRRHAFKESHPSEDYTELSDRVCEYTRDVPLALKVLGSFLCGRRKQEWVSELSKLERIAYGDIQKVLKISYGGLDDEEKKIFLDIANFFNSMSKDFVIYILNTCGFSTEIGISVLSDKSLISLSNDNIITVHDLLQVMAWEIVRQECVEPGKHSRLWDYDDIYHVLTKNKGTEMIEAISLNISSSIERDINLNPQAFAKMENLRLLKFFVSDVWWHNCKVHAPESLEFVFTELQYLYWYGFPLKSLQPNFQPENLVILELHNSNVEELWSGFMQLDNLKRIDLTGSRQVIRCPDLSRAPNLESLNLCKCESLTSIPNCTSLKCLKELILYDCSKLKRLPKLPNNLETLGLSGCKSLVEIPPSFKYLNKVQSLDLCGYQSLMSILDLRGWKSLKYLGVMWCLMLWKVPNSIEILGHVWYRF